MRDQLLFVILIDRLIAYIIVLPPPFVEWLLQQMHVFQPFYCVLFIDSR